MKLQNERQLNATRNKLKLLQEQYAATKQRKYDNEYLRELTLRSLGRLIKQLQEEIITYECHAGLRKPLAPVEMAATNTGEPTTPCTN
jgi:hypothetical protein